MLKVVLIVVIAIILGVLLWWIATLRAEIFLGKQTNRLIYGANGQTAQVTENTAIAIAKRNAHNPYALDLRNTVNYIVFEFENGGRIELAIKDQDTYGTIIEGDRGMLRYRGKEFISFERKV